MPDPDVVDGAILSNSADQLHAVFRAPGRPAKTNPATTLSNADPAGDLSGDGGTSGALLQDRQDIVAGFPVRQVIIWHRSGGINFNPGYFLPNYEVIYLIAKKDFTLAPKANALGSVWRISQKTGNPHPAPFPPDLVRNCLTAVDQGPVLDPFIGSGTTAVVAEERGLDWVGIDVSASYLDMAATRIAAARRDAAE